MKKLLPVLLSFLAVSGASAQSGSVSPEVMSAVYEEVKTPHKYGLVMVPEAGRMIDSPSVFRHGGKWYMTYIVFDGKGYETWLAKSKDLLHWTTLGRTMPFTENTWDASQKAGYAALQDYEWGGSYKLRKYRGKYWFSYLGGSAEGYEAGRLGVGMAWTPDIAEAKEWGRTEKPVLDPTDKDARWYDDHVIYKSSVIHDKSESLGAPFVMFYNAKGDKIRGGVERIAMATSDDMLDWTRYGNDPVIDHGSGISGDAYLTKMGDLWVMFYFGAFWKPGAFERFACSYDLIEWTKWEGGDLISPSEEFDDVYAHKPCVIKYKGIVYHFYNAVDKAGNRCIALATSLTVGKSELKADTQKQ